MKKFLTLFALLIAFAVNGFATTYTVAGSNTTLFGVSWDPTETANDMTLSPTATNIYEWSKENVTLDGGNIEFKVCENHAWANAHPGSNWVINSTTGDYSNGAGVYDVTITFNSDTEEINVTITYKGSAVIPNATIETVQLLGDWNWDATVNNVTLTKGDGNVWTGTLDLSDVVVDQKFKLVVNTTTWIGHGSTMAIDAPAGWVPEDTDDLYNYILKNSTTGYKTYTITATWVEGTSAAEGWTLKIEGATARTNAEITSVHLMGDVGQTWTENKFDVTLTKDGENNRWTGTLDLSSSALDQTFKLVVNGGGDESDGWKGWIGTNNLAISNTTPTGWVLATSENPNENCTLYNSITGYKTYTLTAEWVPSSDYAAGWTLTIAGKDRRDYYVIGGNGEVWTVLGKMDYYEPMDEYNYELDKSTSTFTGKYFAIAPESALNATKDGVEDWSKVIRPVTTSGNFLVELIRYYGDATSGANKEQVWELADDITYVEITYYISNNDFALYPESKVTISSAGYATYSNKYDYLIYADEVSIVSSVTNEAVLSKLEIDNTHGIPGGTGVIVKGSGYFTAIPFDKDIEGFSLVDVTGNMLIGSNNSTYNITGDTGDYEYTAYVLKKLNDKVGFYKLASYTEDNTLAAHKAFLAVPTTSGSAPAFIIIGGGEGTTGIGNVNVNLNDNTIYDLQGRRVENPTKGIYIVNGRKVVIK